MSTGYAAVNPEAYFIAELPSEPIIKNYLDGSTLRQFVFVLASKETYGPEIAQELDKSQFYEKFVKWLENQNKDGILPVLDDGREARSIQAITTGHTFNIDINKARYQIQCKLTYYQGGK
ncbi:hypothetical protein SAMN02745196_02345 [Clostridium collagenovorans DSM 3089]|uniref:Uncharacterized protein n=1 Tax=Clostridium collagenovorans DSM 3089 TaxID=1121306 RepID=A0A1M5XNQ8_9CLOT|nr:hypothetical protein [Clostridium collagenovorans]SHI01441.1 hypothetical protein SAMN02745196_02345 [Clostridium collagenovorans DSM 3089]